MTASLASRVFALPSSCLPAMPSTSSFASAHRSRRWQDTSAIQRAVLQDFLLFEPESLRAERQGPALQRTRRGVHSGKVRDVATRRIEAHHRRRLGHDSQHPRRERVTFQAQRTVKRKEPSAARPAIIIAALDLDPAKSGEPGLSLPRLASAHRLAATRALRWRQSLVKLFEQHLQRRSLSTERAVAKRPPHAVQVRNVGREVRRQLQKLRAELRRHRPEQCRKRSAYRSETRHPSG